MKYLLEYTKRRKSWDIYDMESNPHEIEEPIRLMSISETLMDKLIEGYLVAQGAITVKKILP
jgi:hypothetical protein